MKRYYYAGTARVAMREGSTLRWILGDHLGSTNRLANSDGSPYRMVLYKGSGETRYTDGSLPTTYKFTGQRQESSFGGTEGLYYYGARWYDPALSRFAQADTVGEGDRYAYVGNNPTNSTDPTGHARCDADGYCGDQGKKPYPPYNVNISDEFTEAEKAKIMAAILAIAAKLGGWENFNTIFGGTQFIRDTSISPWGGQDKGGTVHLNPGLLTEYVVVHEMGHVFQGLVYAKDYKNSPANQLADNQENAIKDDEGHVVSGVVNGDYKRTNYGYQSCPGEKACQYEEHPTTIDKNADPPVNPNNSYEDAADMFLNWVYNSFDYSNPANGAGTARYNWWDSRMEGWVNTIKH